MVSCSLLCPEDIQNNDRMAVSQELGVCAAVVPIMYQVASVPVSDLKPLMACENNKYHEAGVTEDICGYRGEEETLRFPTCV